jgi:protein-disulfide isomerase
VSATAFLSRSPSRIAIADAKPRELVYWQLYEEGRHRKGAGEPVLTIVEFGDYECPACKRFHEVSEYFLQTYPDEVSFIYRHWPLPYHRYAFDAARAAECAGLQGRFWEFHDRLLRDNHWIHDAFVRFAAEAGVADLERFRQCALSDEVDAFIRHDAALAASLDSNGTPVLIVNGVLLAATPDTAELAAILATARDRRDQR